MKYKMVCQAAGSPFLCDDVPDGSGFYGNCRGKHLTTEMSLKQILIVIPVFWGSCRQPAPKAAETFVVPADTLQAYKGASEAPPPAVKPYYLPGNYFLCGRFEMGALMALTV